MTQGENTVGGETLSEREEIELLLPWYATGKLSPAESERVDQFLASHPDLQRQLRTIEEDRDETIFANEATSVPNSLDRVLGAIADEAAASPKTASVSASGMLARLGAFLNSFSDNRLGFAAMAAALVIALQAGLLGVISTRTSVAPSGPELAGGEATKASTSVALVRVAPNVEFDVVMSFLKAQDLQIGDGPIRGGFYRVARPGELDEATRASLLKLLGERKDIFVMVLPSN